MIIDLAAALLFVGMIATGYVLRFPLPPANDARAIRKSVALYSSIGENATERYFDSRLEQAGDAMRVVIAIVVGLLAISSVRAETFDLEKLKERC